MNISITPVITAEVKPENFRQRRTLKYCHSPQTARLATRGDRPNLVYGESGLAPYIEYSKTKLARWKDIRAPQKCVLANAAMLKLQKSGYDAFTLTFHLSDYYKAQVKKNQKNGIQTIPAGIADCLKRSLRENICSEGQSKEVYLWFALEEYLGKSQGKYVFKPHGHGGFLVPSDWRVHDREVALENLSAAIAKAVSTGRKKQVNKKPKSKSSIKAVFISNSYERNGVIRRMDEGWGYYASKERPKKIYISQSLTPIAKKYHEEIRKPPTT